jgi:serine protease Do
MNRTKKLGLSGTAALAGLSLTLFAAPPALADAAVQVTPKTKAPEEARTLSRAFAATARAVGPSVVRLDVEAKAPRVARRGRGQVPDNLEVPDFFKRFFEFGEGAPMPEPGRGTGSGVIFDSRGHILTNSHVVENASKVTVVFPDGRELPAEVVGRDSETDVAVLRLKSLPAQLSAARLGDSTAMEVGEWVIAIGSPLGMDQTVTAGIVSSMGKTNGRMRMSGKVRTYIQTDAKINPGNSGGPLVNLDGEVIGINTLINTGPGGAYGFAIPINQARRVAETLIKDGRMRYAFLGVSIKGLGDYEEKARNELGKGLPDKAAVIETVTQGGPAEKAGLRPGDVITKIDGETISNASDVVSYVSSRTIGQEVTVHYLRDGKPRQLKVKLGELPSQDRQEVAAESLEEMGFSVQSLTPDLASALGMPATTRGAIVTEVAPGSAAAQAGLEPEDVVLKVDRTAVSSAQELESALKKAPKSAHVLQVKRGGTTRLVPLPAAK